MCFGRKKIDTQKKKGTRVCVHTHTRTNQHMPIHIRTLTHPHIHPRVHPCTHSTCELHGVGGAGMAFGGGYIGGVWYIGGEYGILRGVWYIGGVMVYWGVCGILQGYDILRGGQGWGIQKYLYNST